MRGLSVRACVARCGSVLLALWGVGCGSEVRCIDPLDDPGLDVDANGAADCMENVVVNGQLREATAPWTAGEDVTIAFDARDARDMTGSGSIRVTSNADTTSPSFRHAEQCIPLTPEGRYVIATRVLIPADQGVAGLGAQMELQLYGEPACAGDPGSPQASDIVMETGRWLVLSDETLAPRARSALVRLTVRKNAGTGPAEILFDDVLVHAR